MAKASKLATLSESDFFDPLDMRADMLWSVNSPRSLQNLTEKQFDEWVKPTDMLGPK